jgi:hypothetical protein
MGDTVSTLLFQPPPPTKLKEQKIIWLNTSKGKKIPGFYISYSRDGREETSRSLTVKELQSARTDEGITLLYSHANAEDLGSIYPWCKFLSKMLRVNLFAYDYTGYGMAYDEGESLWSSKVFWGALRTTENLVSYIIWWLTFSSLIISCYRQPFGRPLLR